MSNEEVKKPTYEFAEVPDGTLNPGSPIKKTIAKTMVVTETFNVYDVLTYIAKLKKAIEDKDKEKEGLEAMLKAYEDELEYIESVLGVQKMEEQYQVELAERVQREAEEAKKLEEAAELVGEILNEPDVEEEKN